MFPRDLQTTFRGHAKMLGRLTLETLSGFSTVDLQSGGPRPMNPRSPNQTAGRQASSLRSHCVYLHRTTQHTTNVCQSAGSEESNFCDKMVENSGSWKAENVYSWRNATC